MNSHPQDPWIGRGRVTGKKDDKKSVGVSSWVYCFSGKTLRRPKPLVQRDDLDPIFDPLPWKGWDFRIPGRSVFVLLRRRLFIETMFRLLPCTTWSLFPVSVHPLVLSTAPSLNSRRFLRRSCSSSTTSTSPRVPLFSVTPSWYLRCNPLWTCLGDPSRSTCPHNPLLGSSPLGTSDLSSFPT